MKRKPIDFVELLESRITYLMHYCKEYKNDPHFNPAKYKSMIKTIKLNRQLKYMWEKEHGPKKKILSSIYFKK